MSLALELIAQLPAPEFGPQLRLPDGHTVAEHCEAWARYWRTFFRTRALYGIQVETSSTSYAKYFMEELACMHDITLSESLRSLVSDYMQVYFADAATEQAASLLTLCPRLVMKRSPLERREVVNRKGINRCCD